MKCRIYIYIYSNIYLRSHFGSRLFRPKAIKLLEPICIGDFLSKADELKRKNVFHTAMLNEFITVLIHDCRIPKEKAYLETARLQALISDCRETFHIIELFGMIRSWGFPVVSELKNISKVRGLSDDAKRFIGPLPLNRLRSVQMVL